MRILVPVIDSVNLLPAARYIVREFLAGERFEVHLLDVRPPRLLRDGADRSLADARALLERFRIPCTLRRGTPGSARSVAALARRLDVDRILLGTARRWSATGLCEASTVERILDAAPVPVLLVAGKDVSPIERYGVAAGVGATLALILSA